MSTRGLIIAMVGAACVGAAAAGGFVAVHMDRAHRALVDAGAPNPPSTPATTTAAAPAAEPPAEPPALPPTPVTSAAPTVTRTTPPGTGKPNRAISATKRTGAVAAPPPSAVTPPAPDLTTPQPPAPAPVPATAPPPSDPPTLVADVPAVDPQPIFDEITVKTDSVIGLALDNPVSSDVAKVEDKVTARVTRDVTVDGRVAIPSNSRLEGVVAVVQRAGKFNAQARIGVRFTALYLPDNTKFPLQTDTLFRDGDRPANEATSKVGAGAVLGAILGAVIGGKKGAAVGAAAGAGGGAAAVAAGHSNEATIPSGVPLTVRLTAPVTVTVARQQDQ